MKYFALSKKTNKTCFSGELITAGKTKMKRNIAALSDTLHR